VADTKMEEGVNSVLVSGGNPPNNPSNNQTNQHNNHEEEFSDEDQMVGRQFLV
jgi:hypothetical protein